MYRPPIPNERGLRAAGEAMRQIKTSKPDVSWIQGPGPTDLWTWIDEMGAIKEQELTFFGRTVLLRKDQVVTGLCHEGQTGAYHGKTGLIDFDTKVDSDTLTAASIVLAAIPERTRNFAVEHLFAAVQVALTGLGLSATGDIR
jgi:hypothetical protein